MTLYVVGNQLPPGITVGVQGDNAAKTFTFVLPRYNGNLDLSAFQAHLVLGNSKGMVWRRSGLPLRSDSESVYVDWQVGVTETGAAGILFVMLCFERISGMVVYQTEPARYHVIPAVGAQEGEPPLEDIPGLMDEFLSQARKYTEEIIVLRDQTKNYSDQAAQKAKDAAYSSKAAEDAADYTLHFLDRMEGAVKYVEGVLLRPYRSPLTGQMEPLQGILDDTFLFLYGLIQRLHRIGMSWRNIHTQKKSWRQIDAQAKAWKEIRLIGGAQANGEQ